MELSSRSLIQDFLPVDNTHVVVGTSNFQLYVYLIQKDIPNILIANLDIQSELSPSERFTRMSFNFRSKQIAMLSHNNVLDITNKVVLVELNAHELRTFEDDFADRLDQKQSRKKTDEGIQRNFS